MADELHAPTGHVFRVERARGPIWYAKYRLPDGRQVEKKIGPAWTGRGRPAAGYVTKQDWLRELLEDARRGTLPGLVRTGATFADAAAEWLRYIEHDRLRKPSTVATYGSLLRSQILPTFADQPIEAIRTAMIESWIARVDRTSATRVKLLAMVHGIFKRARKVWGLKVNPAVDVEKPPLRSTGDVEVFSPEEVWALVRAAASGQDAAIFLTAAFSGLRRGELIALRWRDVDFAGSVIRVRASYSEGVLSTPKSGKVRSIPMAPDVASALAKLGDRGDQVGDDDLVFVGDGGSYVDGSALRKRYDAADQAGWAAPAALSRSAPHIRHADDRQGRHPPGAGMDGSCRHPDHDEVPPLRTSRRGRPLGRGGFPALSCARAEAPRELTGGRFGTFPRKRPETSCPGIH